MKRLFKTVISACLAVVLIFVPMSSGLAASGDAATTAQENAALKSKNEVVYATLGADGGVSAVYVVNQFDLTQAGSVTDHGSYTTVTNLTDTGPIAQQGDTVTFTSDKGNFYYQGNLASIELPWIVGISYTLDGTPIAPPALAGQSGQMEIHITTRQNESVNALFYENYMLQIALKLDSDLCSNISAPDATIAIAGKNTAVNFTVMPKKDADVTLSAAVTDFTMDGIQISGIPLSLSMDLPETDDMISDFEKLADAIDKLNDGVGDLADGTSKLNDGAGSLEDGSANIRDGLTQLSDNSGQLVAASGQINDALSQISLSLSSAGSFNPADMAALPDSLTQLVTALSGISSSLKQMKEDYAAAYASLAAAIDDIPDTAVSQEQLDALYAATDESLHGALDTLADAYAAGRAVKIAYNEGKSAFDAVETTSTTLAGSINGIADTLNTMAVQIGEMISGSGLDQLGELITGLTTLSDQYASFHGGLAGFMDGVVQMADGYAAFHSGLSKFAGGADDLNDGVHDLYDGTCELRDETADLPDELQSRIDELMAEYSGDDFVPVSFVSGQNTNIGLVQFVLKCDGIVKPEETEAAPVDETSETFWDRFTALFKGEA
jgi:X-X-X-Leu-X-X-Gly heptad repeat protein